MTADTQSRGLAPPDPHPVKQDDIVMARLLSGHDRIAFSAAVGAADGEVLLGASFELLRRVKGRVALPRQRPRSALEETADEMFEKIEIVQREILRRMS